jgi:hypothetical protein
MQGGIGSMTNSLILKHLDLLKSKYCIDCNDQRIAEMINKGLLKSLNQKETNMLLDRDTIESGSLQINYPLTNTFNLRLDEPYIDPESGKSTRYFRPKDSNNKLYIPPFIDIGIHEWILITEGELKALAASMRGMVTLGLSGIWGWREIKEDSGSKALILLNGGKKSALPDKEALIEDLKRNWTGKKIGLIYDSDITTSNRGWSAFTRLAEQLYQQGAKAVKIYTLSEIEQK